MTTHSGDAPTVMLFSNTSTQWRSAIHATVAISRIQTQQGLRGPEHMQSEFQTAQNGPTSKHDDTHSQSANQAAQLDPKALDRALEDTNPEVELLKLLRDELVKELDTYGIVLVLLAGITFVAILQPPGSFENGKLQESLLVSFFMLLATLSFFIACTGLGAVMVGCAQLFQPFFHNKLAKYTGMWKSKQLLPAKDSLSTHTFARQGFRNGLLRCWKIRQANHVAYDDITVLAELCIGNVYRTRRIRIYLAVSLVLCIAAYICGALAVMVTNDRQRYLLIGAMAVGGAVVLFEICITVSAPTKPACENIDGSLQQGFPKQLCALSQRRDGHRHKQTLP